MKADVHRLSKEFYTRPDVLQISRDLLGKFLVTRNEGGQITAGKIVETEAYAGTTDRASHAFGGRRSKRTEIMYREGGSAYVYLIYGMYSLFNIVTNKVDIPHAVLIRAIEPVDGIELMLKRRAKEKLQHNICGGPGLLTKALGINTSQTGLSLLNGNIWLEDRGTSIVDDEIIKSPRVGVAYAGEDALLPWRFRIKDNPWTSKAK